MTQLNHKCELCNEGMVSYNSFDKLVYKCDNVDVEPHAFWSGRGENYLEYKAYRVYNNVVWIRSSINKTHVVLNWLDDKKSHSFILDFKIPEPKSIKELSQFFDKAAVLV
jgi:hypothetical protein